MKNLIVLIATILIPMCTFAQTDAVTTFYEKYQDVEDAVQVEFTGWLTKKIVQYSDDEDVKRALKDVTGLRILVLEEANAAMKADFKTLRNTIPRGNYEPLLKVREGKHTTVEFLIKEANGIVDDVLLMVHDDEELVLLNLTGKFNLRDLDKIDLDMDIDGINHFDKLKKEDKNKGGKKRVIGA